MGELRQCRVGTACFSRASITVALLMVILASILNEVRAFAPLAAFSSSRRYSATSSGSHAVASRGRHVMTASTEPMNPMKFGPISIDDDKNTKLVLDLPEVKVLEQVRARGCFQWNEPLEGSEQLKWLGFPTHTHSAALDVSCSPSLSRASTCGIA